MKLEDSEEVVTVYLSKYALTKGILVFKTAVFSKSDPNMVRLGGCWYIHKPDWHFTLDAARIHADLLRERALASLQRKQAKLKALNFFKMEPVESSHE